MHELGIADSILEAVRVEMRRYPAAHPLKVGVRIGELAGVDPSALEFGFQALTAGTEWASLSLEVEACPRRHRCHACAETFAVLEYNFACPACGSPSSECVGGDELELTYVELEEP